MEHDLLLRAAARAIYDACYPSDDWSPVGFDEADRCGLVHYRHAVGATQRGYLEIEPPARTGAL